jgi:outer membrane receptor protein involved in Fe transport
MPTTTPIDHPCRRAEHRWRWAKIMTSLAVGAGLTAAASACRAGPAPPQPESLLQQNGHAQAAAQVTKAAAPTPPGAAKNSLEEIVVRATRRSVDGPLIDRSLGATSYTLGQAQIGNAPGGANATLATQLERLPGVVQDSYGEIHIRGEHGNAQYRINGLQLPEGLEGFGQEFDTHYVKTVTLITGTLPAAYGLKLSGVIDIETKTGADLQGGTVGIYGGSFGTIRPFATGGGTYGAVDIFGSLSYDQNALGIENPTSGVTAIHDRTTQYNGFGGATWHVDDRSRLTLIAGATNEDFEIPDIAGHVPRFIVAGQPAIPSSALNENQNEQRSFAALGYETSFDGLTVRPALFYSENRILFTPDPIGDLQYSGVAGRTLNRLTSGGGQIDSTYEPASDHLLAFGGRLSLDGYKRQDSTSVFPANANATQASDIPITIDDKDRKTGRTLSVYLQDEWSVTHRLTVNYGLRYDNSLGFSHADQVSPRLSAVYELTPDASVHAGYARYFTPPGLEFVTPGTVALFRGTTNAATAPVQSAPYPERANYVDAGYLQRLGAFTVTADMFYKQSDGGIDLGQFGSAVVLVPFNYNHGHTYGVEANVNAARGPWTAGLSFSYVRAEAIGITSDQTAFPLPELLYIDKHVIILDHDQPFTVAINTAYQFDDHRTKISGDALLGSGLRYGFANLGQLSPHYVFNAGLEHRIPLKWAYAKDIRLRFDATNILDQAAALRAGSGVGIAAAQYLPRRGFFGTIAMDF